MMIRNTPKVYDILLSYHTQVSDFYKQLPETSKLIKDITWECNTVVKDGYKITTSCMHDMLSHASFDVLFCRFWLHVRVHTYKSHL
jgi:hypothetical protein